MRVAVDVLLRGQELSALIECCQYGLVGLEDVDAGEARHDIAVPTVVPDVLRDLETHALAQLEVIVTMGRRHVDQTGSLVRPHEVGGMKRHGVVVPRDGV